MDYKNQYGCHFIFYDIENSLDDNFFYVLKIQQYPEIVKLIEAGSFTIADFSKLLPEDKKKITRKFKLKFNVFLPF